MRPEYIVVGSSTIASAITGSAPGAESSADYRVFCLLLLSTEFRGFFLGLGIRGLGSLRWLGAGVASWDPRTQDDGNTSSFITSAAIDSNAAGRAPPSAPSAPTNSTSPPPHPMAPRPAQVVGCGSRSNFPQDPWWVKFLRSLTHNSDISNQPSPWLLGDNSQVMALLRSQPLSPSFSHKMQKWMNTMLQSQITLVPVNEKVGIYLV